MNNSSEKSCNKLEGKVRRLIITLTVILILVLGYAFQIIQITYGYPEEMDANNTSETEAPKTSEQSKLHGGAELIQVPEQFEKPKQPVMPEQPEETEQPIESEEPEETEQPIESEQPEETEQPIEPEEPKETEQSIVPEEPEETEQPIEPEEPEETEQPIVSEEPEKTEQPIVSERPEETEQPIVSEQPEEPTTSEIDQPKAKLSAYNPSKNYYYNLSYEEKVLIAKVIYREARAEPFEGQVAVAAVILNRYFYGENLNGLERDSIYSVVTQKHQFADISVVTMEMLSKYPNCMDAVDAACRGWDPTRILFENGAFFFYSLNGLSDYQAGLRAGIQTLQINAHFFHESFDSIEYGESCMSYQTFKEEIPYDYDDYKAAYN